MTPSERIRAAYALCPAHPTSYGPGCVDCAFRKTVVVEILLEACGAATKSLG